MDVKRKNNDLSQSAASHRTPVRHGRAGMSVENGSAQHLDTVLVSAKNEAPSLIPSHPLPENIPRSTAPALPSQSTPVPVEREMISLANHVSLQIFSTAATRNTKNVMVFLHGGPDLEYSDAYEPLTKSCLDKGYTVIAPEIAGSGTDGLVDTSNSYSGNYVRDLKSVVHCLRERPDMQEKEFCVLAHSWGGFQLASLLTDETAEEREFFKKVADAADYNDAAPGSILAFKVALVGNFKSRHAGGHAEVQVSDEMTMLHNPLIDQSLNEKFSPFYRLDKMPSAVSCLFFHAGDDEQVPLSQSVEAFAKINDAGATPASLFRARVAMVSLKRDRATMTL